MKLTETMKWFEVKLYIAIIFTVALTPILCLLVAFGFTLENPDRNRIKYVMIGLFIMAGLLLPIFTTILMCNSQIE